MQVSADHFLELGERRRTALERAAGYGVASALVLGLAAAGALRLHGAVVAAIAGLAAAAQALLIAHVAGLRQLTMLDEALVHGWRTSLPGEELARRERTLLSEPYRQRLSRALYREAVDLTFPYGGRSSEDRRRERMRLIAIARALGDAARPVDPHVLVLAGRLLEAGRERQVVRSASAEHGRALARLEETLGLAAEPEADPLQDDVPETR